MTSNPESAMAMAMRPSPSDQPSRFLDLPCEIRTMIYIELFVVKKLLCDYDYNDEGTPQTLRRSADVGCVVIATLEPPKYDSLFMKRSSFLAEGWINPHAWQATTYSCNSGIDLCLLATNRQIYQETSEIFYSQNVFYFNDLSVAIPFLKDRGTRSRSLMRKLSIQYPRPKISLEAPFVFHDSFLHDQSTWEDICCYLSLHIQNLAQLDMRVDRGFGQFNASLLDCGDGKKLQSPTDFPAKQRKDLATLSQDVTLTLSQNHWCDWRDDERIRDANLFTPLQPWLRESITQIRAKHFSQEERLLRKNVLERYWQAHRKRRNDQDYHVRVSRRTWEIDESRGVPHEVRVESDNDSLIDYMASTDHVDVDSD